jgi:hypothetical protein
MAGVEVLEQGMKRRNPMMMTTSYLFVLFLRG